MNCGELPAAVGVTSSARHGINTNGTISTMDTMLARWCLCDDVVRAREGRCCCVVFVFASHVVFCYEEAPPCHVIGVADCITGPGRAMMRMRR